MIAVAYLRVSTQGQVDKFGLKEQKSIIEDYANGNGYKIVEWFTDGGFSGVKEERPAMDALLYGDIQNPPIEAVIVAKSDRVARDIKLYYYYLMLLEKKGIKLISATEPVVNDETGLGNIYYALMLFVAEQERKNILMRTSLGREKKAMMGGYIGGRPPYGYRVFNHELVIEPHEADTVRYIFKLRDNGYSLHKIATALIDRGVRTRVGTYFSIGALGKMIGREAFYKGYSSKDGKLVLGKHDKILKD